MDQLSKLRQANQLEYRLGKLPKTLNNAYTEIFQSIEDGDRETLERAVKWIMCARRPLRTREILDAVRLSAEPGGTVLHEDPKITEETFLELCSHLVIKDSKLDEWKFPHASVIEYFEEVHQWDIERAHSLVAKICLLCLIEGYTSQKMSEAKEDKTIFHNKEGIEYYIRHNWDLHVLALENTQPFEAEVSNLLQIFLGIDKSPNQSSQQYRRWFYDRYRYRYFSDKEYVPTMTYLGSNFEPIENPVFGICILGFCNLLKDYWIPGIDVIQTNRFQMDLLSLAAHYGQVNLCCKFIELGSNVNRQLDSPSRSQSALCAAVSFGSIEAVKFLLGKGADPNLPLTGASAVCASITKGKGTEYIEVLREAGADLNLPCGPRCSLAYPFESAAADGNVEAAKYLLNHGANVDLYSENGIFGSALTAAAHGGSEQLCLLLIDRGVDVNASLRGGRYGSALAAASTREVCQLLIKHGADVNASLKCGEYGSALAAAAYAGNLAVCRLLVENQADVNAVLEYGKYGSALGAALVSSHCDLDVIKYLIEDAHADASVLSITSPKINKRKHTLLAALSMARTTKPKTSYMLERNLVERSTLLRIGFEEDDSHVMESL